MKRVVISLLILITFSEVSYSQIVDKKLNKVKYSIATGESREAIEKDPNVVVSVYFNSEKYRVKFKNIKDVGFLNEQDFLVHMKRFEEEKEHSNLSYRAEE
jgi:hypothetical protein